MHCWIYEVAEQPITHDERISLDEIPDWFRGSIADSMTEASDYERNQATQLLVMLLCGECTLADDELRFSPDLKERYFVTAYERFRKELAALTEIDYPTFSGQGQTYNAFLKHMRQLNESCAERFGHYIYDKDAEELYPLDEWVRDLDLTAPVYLGTVINYHY